MAKVVLIKPEAPARAVTGKLSPRLRGLDGVRVGILDNSKGNADHLLRDVVEGLQAHGARLVIARSKPHASYPAAAEVLDELAREADCVVTAMGA